MRGSLRLALSTTFSRTSVKSCKFFWCHAASSCNFARGAWQGSDGRKQAADGKFNVVAWGFMSTVHVMITSRSETQQMLERRLVDASRDK